MLKQLLLYLIRIKNPAFQFDASLTGSMVLSMAFSKLAAVTRGILKLLLHFRKPQLLLLGTGTRFFHMKGIRFGKLVEVGDYGYLSSLGKEGIAIGDYSSIGAFSRLVVSTSFDHTGRYIRIGKHVGIGEFAYLGGGGGLEIGDDCIIGQYFSCHPENHNYTNPALPIRLSGVTRKGIKIGNNCWIGSKVTILDGVRIGKNCVIAAGAVVTRDIPDHVVAGGVPARILKNTVSVNEEAGEVKFPESTKLFQ